MKTVNLFFYNGSVWNNAVGHMAREIVNRVHTPDLGVKFGATASESDLTHYQAVGPANQGSKPGLMSVHQISPRMPGRRLEDMAPALRRHLGVVVLTNAMAEQVREYNKRVYVIPGGVGESFTPAPPEERLERVKREPFTVGLVGHQRHGKFDTKGSEALENVIQLCPGYRYRIAGHGWGDLVESQRMLGRDVQNVDLPYEKMPDFYRGLDVLLCLSREEGGYLPILEALACGVPVFTTRVGYAEVLPLPEIAFIDFLGENYLANAGQVALKLHTLNENRDGTPGAAAAMTAIVEGLTWQRFADRHEALYREMLSDA